MINVNTVMMKNLQNEKKLDPIPMFAAYLIEVGVLTEELEKEMEERIMKEVNEATDYAENAAYAEPESAMLHVYAEDGGNE